MKDVGEEWAVKVKACRRRTGTNFGSNGGMALFGDSKGEGWNESDIDIPFNFCSVFELFMPRRQL